MKAETLKMPCKSRCLRQCWRNILKVFLDPQSANCQADRIFFVHGSHAGKFDPTKITSEKKKLAWWRILKMKEQTCKAEQSCTSKTHGDTGWKSIGARHAKARIQEIFCSARVCCGMGPESVGRFTDNNCSLFFLPSWTNPPRRTAWTFRSPDTVIHKQMHMSGKKIFNDIQFCHLRALWNHLPESL